MNRDQRRIAIEVQHQIHVDRTFDSITRGMVYLEFLLWGLSISMCVGPVNQHVCGACQSACVWGLSISMCVGPVNQHVYKENLRGLLRSVSEKM